LKVFGLLKAEGTAQGLYKSLYKTVTSGQDMQAFLITRILRAQDGRRDYFEHQGVLNLSPRGRSAGPSFGFKFSINFSPNTPPVLPVVLGFTNRKKPVLKGRKKNHE